MKLKNLLKRIVSLLLCLPFSIIIYWAYKDGYFGDITLSRIVEYILVGIASTLIVCGFAYGFWYAFIRKDDYENEQEKTPT